MQYIGLIDCILCMNTEKTIWTVYFLGHVSIHVITVFWTKSVQKTVSPYIFFQKTCKNFQKKKNFCQEKKIYSKFFDRASQFFRMIHPKKLCRPYTPHTAKMGPIYGLHALYWWWIPYTQNPYGPSIFVGNVSIYVITVFSDKSSEKTVSPYVFFFQKKNFPKKKIFLSRKKNYSNFFW